MAHTPAPVKKEDVKESESRLTPTAAAADATFVFPVEEGAAVLEITKTPFCVRKHAKLYRARARSPDGSSCIDGCVKSIHQPGIAWDKLSPYITGENVARKTFKGRHNPYVHAADAAYGLPDLGYCAFFGAYYQTDGERFKNALQRDVLKYGANPTLRKLQKKISGMFFGAVNEALRHAQLCGLLHCDLKLENLLVETKPARINPSNIEDKTFGQLYVRERACVVVADFANGMRMSEESKKNGGKIAIDHLRGTQNWRAPEIELAKGQAWVSPRSDIYSFGLIILRFFTPPTTTGSKENILDVSHVPKEFRPMVLSMIASDPTQRPTPEEVATVFPVPSDVTQFNSDWSELMAQYNKIINAARKAEKLAVEAQQKVKPEPTSPKGLQLIEPPDSFSLDQIQFLEQRFANSVANGALIFQDHKEWILRQCSIGAYCKMSVDHLNINDFIKVVNSAAVFSQSSSTEAELALKDLQHLLTSQRWTPLGCKSLEQEFPKLKGENLLFPEGPGDVVLSSSVPPAIKTVADLSILDRYQKSIYMSPMIQAFWQAHGKWIESSVATDSFRMFHPLMDLDSYFNLLAQISITESLESSRAALRAAQLQKFGVDALSKEFPSIVGDLVGPIDQEATGEDQGDGKLKQRDAAGDASLNESDDLNDGFQLAEQEIIPLELPNGKDITSEGVWLELFLQVASPANRIILPKIQSFLATFSKKHGLNKNNVKKRLNFTMTQKEISDFWALGLGRVKRSEISPITVICRCLEVMLSALTNSSETLTIASPWRKKPGRLVDCSSIIVLERYNGTTATPKAPWIHMLNASWPENASPEPN